MRIRVVEREGVREAMEEALTAFFSGDPAEAEPVFADHENGRSSTLMGYVDGELVGILTIRWEPKYPPFRAEGIPLIQNIEIRWERRGQGLGGDLMEHAERYAARRASKVGICVGIFDAYGPAQRLYAKRGYIPDGRGVCVGHEPLRQGQKVTVDHDLLLWLTKDLSTSSR